MGFNKKNQLTCDKCDRRLLADEIITITKTAVVCEDGKDYVPDGENFLLICGKCV